MSARWLAAVTIAVLASSAQMSVARAQAVPHSSVVQADPAKPEMRESCTGLVARRDEGVRPQRVVLSPDSVRLTFVGHATFLIESPQGVRIATDYNDFVRPAVLPDIATMNHAHITHYTDNPDPGIKLVLRGWTADGSPARHDVQYRDVRVRNVVTNTRTWSGATERNGNSIFIFEIAGLCIVHLGHLHHTLTQQQLDEIGRPDVVMVPVDGSYTLDLDGMVDVLRSLKAQVMVPMHYFGATTLQRFLGHVGAIWPVETALVPTLVVSKATLPPQPKIVVLPGH
jgi:L-ascorbate metabolism protein UlaG (beta-lactamase superfamily)